MEEELRALAREEMKTVIKSLAKAANQEKPNHHCARLLAELAGFARPSVLGRPPRRGSPPQLKAVETPEELAEKESFYDEILEGNNGEV